MLMISVSSYAQHDNIYISVAMPKDCSLDNNTKSLLKNKLLNVASNVGVSSTEFGAIIMVPEVNVINSNIIYGGMRNISSLQVCITITIKNMITGTVFNSTQINSSGEGYSETEATRSAINNINISSSNLSTFIKESKNKIIDYYNNNTIAIINKANNLAVQQCYDQALALLSTYPESLSGYKQVSSVIYSIFKKCQTHYCNRLLISAQAAYSKSDYEMAAEIISLIDPESSCASEAKTLLKTIKKSLDKAYNDAIQLEKDKIKSEEKMTLARINAIKDVVVAYFEQQTEYVFFW